MTTSTTPAAGWEAHAAEWRRPEQVLAHWRDAAEVDRALLSQHVRGAFWEVLERSGQTLLVTREYEHLVFALSVVDGRPRVSFMPLPHPSGIAVDAARGRVHIASTRNPNQLFELRPVTGALERADRAAADPAPDAPLVPVRTRFLPGCAYLHDLAYVAGRLHATAVGMNAIVDLDASEEGEVVWWPRSVERDGRADLARNHLQLNSIAAGPDLARSCFTASTAAPGRRRPGDPDFAVDGRGVVFAGDTREPIACGLTRPHSARLHAGELWVQNSGYGQLGRVRDGRFEALAQLPGWTRGLAFAGSVAFAGVSRVIERFRQYAPGLDVERSTCGVHALDTASGETLGSLSWPAGNQIFGIECIPRELTRGLAFDGRDEPLEDLFYSYTTARTD